MELVHAFSWRSELDKGNCLDGLREAKALDSGITVT